MTDPLIGQTLNQKFKIVRLLGEGGMGKVYAGEQLGINRKVAIKVLHENLSKIPSIAVRFEREALAAGRITHPNSVTIFDFGKDQEGRLYLAMEYLEGEPLSARMKREGRFSVASAVAIISQLLETLEVCHNAGVVHRDLKPDNIFLCPGHEREIVKILDYGIARIAEGPEVTKTGQIVGTPAYMSPEQATGGKPTFAVDIYAVGVILFEMLTGRVIYQEKSSIDLFRKHLLAPIPTLKEAAPDRLELNPFEPIIQKALAKKPDARFSSAKSFREVLGIAERALQNGPLGNLWDSRPTMVAQQKLPMAPTQAEDPTAAATAPTQAPLDENGDMVATIADPKGPTLELSATMERKAIELAVAEQQAMNSAQRMALEETAPAETQQMERLPEALLLGTADTAIGPAPTPGSSSPKVRTPSATPRVSLDSSKIKLPPKGQQTTAPQDATLQDDDDSPAPSSQPSLPAVKAPSGELPFPKVKGLAEEIAKNSEAPAVDTSIPAGSESFFTAPDQQQITLPLEPAPPRQKATRWPFLVAALLLVASVALWVLPGSKAQGVLLQTNPPGAKVSVGGALQSGVTPLSVELPLGKIKLEVSKEGCEPYQSELEISPELSQLFVVLTCR